MKLKPLHRQVEIRAEMLDPAARTLTFPYSSEAPVPRWFGTEVLDHSPASVRMDRINSGAPLLFNHGPGDVIGVVESASLGSDKRGYATVRFARTPRADEVLGMIHDGILRNVSFMYQVHEFAAEQKKGKSNSSAPDEFRATDWEPMEVSIVTVPADYSVGIGRAQASEEIEVRIRASSQPAVTADPKGAPAMNTETEIEAAFTSIWLSPARHRKFQVLQGGLHRCSGFQRGLDDRSAYPVGGVSAYPATKMRT